MFVTVLCWLAACLAQPVAPAPVAVEADPDSVTIDARLMVHDPVVVGGLSVFLVTDMEADQRPDGDYVLLSKALTDQTLTISEVDEGGTVPVLMAHNTGTVPVLAMAGDVINGGKQDRVVTQDVLIEPSDDPQALAVNCVEQSRWSAGNQGLSFSYGGRGEVDLTKTVQTAKSQSETWSKVAELNDKRGQAPTSGTYMATLKNSDQSKVDEAVRRLEPVAGEKAVGVVVAINGDLKSAEIYDNTNIFSAARSGLLRSVVMDAAGFDALEGDAADLTAASAAAWVRDARAAKAQQTVEQVGSDYVELESEGTKNYELRKKDGKKLKETIYAK